MHPGEGFASGGSASREVEQTPQLPSPIGYYMITGYGQEVGGTHATVVHTCFCFF